MAATLPGPASSPVRISIVQRLPRATAVIIGVAFVTAVAAADWLAGPTVSLEMLYALAVMAATWIGGRTHGYLAAGLAAADSLAAHAARMDPIMVTPAGAWNAVTRFAVLWLIAALVGRLRLALMLQRHHAMTDPLTGTLNRRAFEAAADRERLRAAREQTPITVAYMDLDGFKAYNDRLGHAAGDRILTRFAETVSASIRGSDILSRIGGDEFALLLPNTDARSAVVVMTRIRRALAEGCADCPEEAVTISAGIATYHEAPETVGEMILESDRLMYRAKRNGRDRIVGEVLSGSWRRWGERTRADAERVLADIEAVSGL